MDVMDAVVKVMEGTGRGVAFESLALRSATLREALH